MSVTFYILVFSVIIAEACIPVYHPRKFPGTSKLLLGPWIEKNTTRKITDDCVCGQSLIYEGSTEAFPPWKLFVYVKKPYRHNPVRHTSCIGTIITTNIIIVGESCLANSGFSIDVYDSWNVFTSKRKFQKDNVIVSSEEGGEGEKFEVDKFIYLDNLILGGKQNVWNDGDVLILIKLSANFTGTSPFRPICVPSLNEAYLFEDRVYHYRVPEFTTKFTGTLEVHGGAGLSRETCQSEINYNISRKANLETKTLPLMCFDAGTKFTDHELPFDSPIFLKKPNDTTYYLAGHLKHLDGEEGHTNGRFIVFYSSLIPIIKYLEYKISQHDSKWCKTIKLPANQSEDILDCDQVPLLTPKEALFDLNIEAKDVEIKNGYFATPEFVAASPIQDLPSTFEELNNYNLSDAELIYSVEINVPLEIKMDHLENVTSVAENMDFKFENEIILEPSTKADIEKRIITRYQQVVLKKDENQILDPAASIQYIYSRPVNVLPCHYAIISLSYRLAENVPLKYILYSVVSGAHRRTLQQILPSGMEYVRDLSCTSILAKWEGNMSLTFGFDFREWHTTEILPNSECAV